MRRRFAQNIRSLAVIVLISATLPITAGVVVPIDLSRGLVETEVILDGRVKGRFGIDTGADKLYIDKHFATENGFRFLHPTQHREVVSVEGNSDVSYVELRSLAIDDERMYNLTATVVDIGSLGGGKGNHPDGLIGFELLREFYITVDYQNEILELQIDEPDFLRGRQYVSIPFKEQGHMIVLEADLNDVSAPMMLDYCASYTLVTPALAERLGLTTSVQSIQRVKRIDLGEGIFAENVPVVVADLSNLERSGSRVSVQGILGGSFLQFHKITVDYMRDRIHVHL